MSRPYGEDDRRRRAVREELCENPLCLRERRVDQVVLGACTGDGEGVYRLRAYGVQRGVEPRALGVQHSGEPVDGVRTVPSGEAGVHRLSQAPVVLIPLPRESVRQHVGHRREPRGPQRDTERLRDRVQLLQLGHESRGPGGELVDHMHRDRAVDPHIEHSATTKELARKRQ